MLHREILNPQEVLKRIPHLSEGLFAIRCELTNKTYQIILYKYEKDYFLMENPALVSVLLDKKQNIFWTSEKLLDEVETCFENNYYQPVTKEWVNLDLNTLNHLSNVDIKFFDLEE